ncbi:MAG: hypothetical protein NTU95_02485 [Methanothrix sp.]|nr:hypothetical protein [Methanothrix sp.]
MRALGRGRCCPRGPPSVGLAGRFSGRGILESNGNWLLLSDNYNRTTNDLTTEAQSAQRTHRDDLLTKVRAVSGLAILAERPEAAPGSLRAASLAGPLLAFSSDRAVRGCGVIVRAGWDACALGDMLLDRPKVLNADFFKFMIFLILRIIL